MQHHETQSRLMSGAPLYQVKADFLRTLVHELLAEIAIEPSNLSQQLGVLRRAGLVVQRREGAEVVYSIGVPEIRDLLLVARQILLRRLADQENLREQLQPEQQSTRGIS